MSLARVLTFILILTEALCSQRAVCSPFYFCTRREWLWRLYPIPYHGLKENVFMVHFRSKKKREEEKEGYVKRIKRGICKVASVIYNEVRGGFKKGVE